MKFPVFVATSLYMAAQVEAVVIDSDLDLYADLYSDIYADLDSDLYAEL